MKQKTPPTAHGNPFKSQIRGAGFVLDDSLNPVHREYLVPLYHIVFFQAESLEGEKDPPVSSHRARVECAH